jgi:hypothetical protein
VSKLILQADHIPHAELFVSPVESHLLWFSSYNPVFEEKMRAFLQASWTGTGAGVKSLQIPCMMQGNVLAAEVKQDGMVGTVVTFGTDISAFQRSGHRV